MKNFLKWFRVRFYTDGQINVISIVAFVGAIAAGFDVDVSNIASWGDIVTGLSHAVSSPGVFFGGLFVAWTALHNPTTTGLGDGKTVYVTTEATSGHAAMDAITAETVSTVTEVAPEAVTETAVSTVTEIDESVVEAFTEDTVL